MGSLNDTTITPDICYQACYAYFTPGDQYYFFFNIYPPDSTTSQALVCSCSLTCLENVPVPHSNSFVVNKGTVAPTIQPTSSFQCTNQDLTFKSKLMGVAVKQQKDGAKTHKKGSVTYVAKEGRKVAYEMTLNNPDKHEKVEHVGLQVKLPPGMEQIVTKVQPKLNRKKIMRRTRLPDGTSVLTWCDFTLGKKKSVKFTVKFRFPNDIEEDAVTLEATTFQAPAPCEDLYCGRPVSEIEVSEFDSFPSYSPVHRLTCVFTYVCMHVCIYRRLSNNYR